MRPISISTLPRNLRNVARAADTNADAKLTREELTSYELKQSASYQRPAFIIGDLFPWLDKASRKNRSIEKNLAKAADIGTRFDTVA